MRTVTLTACLLFVLSTVHAQHGGLSASAPEVKLPEASDDISLDTNLLNNSDRPSNTVPYKTYILPTAFGLPKGAFSYSNQMAMYNHLQYGINDHLSVSIGMMPTFIMEGSPAPVWVSAKLVTRVGFDYLHAGASVSSGLLFNGGIEGEVFNFTTVIGMVTVGNPDLQGTFGMGYAWFGGESLEQPAYMLNGLIRIGNKWYVVTDNILLQGLYTVTGVYGVRIMLGTAGLDIGISRTAYDSDFIMYIPVLGVTVPF